MNDDDNDNVVSTVAESKSKLSAHLELFILGVCGAWHGELWTYPLDVAKTRLQVQGEGLGRSGKRLGMVGMVLELLRKEGFFTLYAGFGTMLFRSMFFNSMRTVYYDLFRQHLSVYTPEGKKVLSLPRATISAAMAGALAQSLFSPLDKVKIQAQLEGQRRLQGKPPRETRMIKSLMNIYRDGGIRGLYLGNGSSMLRALMLTVGDTAGYDISKRHLQKWTGLPDSRLLQFLCAVSAGAFATTLCTPADVIKSRIMNQPVGANGKGTLYKSTIDCITKLVREEGVMALYKGFVPCWIRVGPYTLIFWVTLEQLRRLRGSETF